MLLQRGVVSVRLLVAREGADGGLFQVEARGFCGNVIVVVETDVLVCIGARQRGRSSTSLF